MVEDERLGAVAWERWGPGSIIVLALSLVSGPVLLAQWSQSHYAVELFAGSLALFYAGMVFAVKLFEEIHPIKRVNHDIVGMQGKVLLANDGPIAAVVKVDSESWSAWSKSALSVDELVVVVRREGNHLWVERSSVHGATSITRMRH